MSSRPLQEIEKSNETQIAPVEADLAVASALNTFPDVRDGGYGWVCVMSIFIINGFVWGKRNLEMSIGR